MAFLQKFYLNWIAMIDYQEIKLPAEHSPLLVRSSNACFSLKSVGYTKSELLRHHILLQCGTNHAALFIVGSPDG